MIRTKYNNSNQPIKNTLPAPAFPNRICSPRNQNSSLTLKEELFVRAICCYPDSPTFDNLTAAMIAAGYKTKTAGIMACEMVKRPKIASAIEKYRRKIIQEFDISPKKILQEIAATAFSDFGDFYSNDGQLKNLKNLSKTARVALHSVKVQVNRDADGNPTITQDIKLHDKLKGLELLGKYHKLWSENNVNITNINGDVEVSVDDRARNTRLRLLESLTQDEDDGKE